MNEAISDLTATVDLTDGEAFPPDTQSTEDAIIEEVSTFEDASEEVLQEPTTSEDSPSTDECSEEKPSNEKDTSREDALLAEISRLKDELSQRDAMAERIAREGEEFRALYPEASIEDLPDSVWGDVGKGIPLAAAYALFERRRFYTEKKAAEYNQANNRRSSGSLEPTAPDYFSPAEVRAMSQNEVRANYDKIMRSMQKWH